MFGDDTVNVEEWEGKNFISFILRDRERERVNVVYQMSYKRKRISIEKNEKEV